MVLYLLTAAEMTPSPLPTTIPVPVAAAFQMMTGMLAALVIAKSL